jgi:hypothetical protein
MKSTLLKILKFAVLAMIIFSFASGCSDNSVGTSNDELDTCLGTSVPFPATATITACMNLGEEGKGATFEPGISWSQSLDFFSGNYSTGGWTLTRENIPENTSGERSAEWWAEGQSYDVGITLTAFGDSDTGFMVGVIGLYNK